MTKLKAIREVTTTIEGTDFQNMTVAKGTKLFVITEGPVAPFGNHHRVLVVRVDNGTGHLDLMPETILRNKDVGVE